MALKELDLSYYKSYDVERWMWECPLCEGQSSVHVNRNYDPCKLTCSKCFYIIRIISPLGGFDPRESTELVAIVYCHPVTKISVLMAG